MSSRLTAVFVSEASRPFMTPAVGRGDGVLHEVPLDAPARVEQMDEQLRLRMRGDAGEVGADFSALAVVPVALGALLGEDELALGGVAAGFKTTGASSSITF